MGITLTIKAKPGKLIQTMDLLMGLSWTSPMLAHQTLIFSSTCAKTLLFMESLVWLGLELSVDPAAGKDTKLLSTKKEKVLFQLQRYESYEGQKNVFRNLTFTS